MDANATAGTSSTTSSSFVDETDMMDDNHNNPHLVIGGRTRTSIHGLTKERIQRDSSVQSSFARHRVPTTTNSTASLLRSRFSLNTRKKSLLHRWNDDNEDESQQQSKGNSISNLPCLPNKFDWMSLLPCTKWLVSYNWKTSLWKDLIAGLTVGVMVVPQSMSYAKLAGLPVEYGLYSALMPVYLYSLFGSSRQLAVGPVALISLLLATGLDSVLRKNDITPENTPIDEYNDLYGRLAIQTSALVGLTYIGMGLLRLGFVTIFLSHPVISGFTTGAAVIIGMSQIQYFLGYPVEKSDRLHVLLERIFANIDQFNYKTFLVGVTSTLILVLLKQLGKSYPKFSWVRPIGPLSVTVIAIILQAIFDLEQYGIPIVGTIPKGLPSITVSELFPVGGDVSNGDGGVGTVNVSDMMTLVFSIAIVGFMESIAIAKQLASKHSYELDSSTELIGLGMANLFGSGFFQGYPITGSFSRSAVNNESGAQSGLSGIFSATLVMLVLLLLTPVFQLLPLAILASIVVSGVIGLLDYPEAIHLWKVHKFDFLTWIIAFLGTLFLGVEFGLAIAVGVSLLVVLYESAYPPTSIMGRLPGTSHYRNVKQYPMAECYDGIVVVRIDAPIYFANTQHVRDKIRKYEERANVQAEERLQKNREATERRKRNADEEIGIIDNDDFASSSAPSPSSSSSHVKYMILELSPVSHVDTSALHIFDDMHKTYKSTKNIQMCFCNPSRAVMEKMVKSGFVDRVGEDHFFVSIQDAIEHCLDEMDMMETAAAADTNNNNGADPDDDHRNLKTDKDDDEIRGDDDDDNVVTDVDTTNSVPSNVN